MKFIVKKFYTLHPLCIVLYFFLVLIFKENFVSGLNFNSESHKLKTIFNFNKPILVYNYKTLNKNFNTNFLLEMSQWVNNDPSNLFNKILITDFFYNLNNDNFTNFTYDHYAKGNKLNQCGNIVNEKNCDFSYFSKLNKIQTYAGIKFGKDAREFLNKLSCSVCDGEKLNFVEESLNKKIIKIDYYTCITFMNKMGKSFKMTEQDFKRCEKEMRKFIPPFKLKEISFKFNYDKSNSLSLFDDQCYYKINGNFTNFFNENFRVNFDKIKLLYDKFMHKYSVNDIFFDKSKKREERFIGNITEIIFKENFTNYALDNIQKTISFFIKFSKIKTELHTSYQDNKFASSKMIFFSLMKKFVYFIDIFSKMDNFMTDSFSTSDDLQDYQVNIY
jgi:hypothetical protein